MKAILNKNFADLMKALDYYWDNRKRLQESDDDLYFESPDFLGYPKMNNMSWDLVDAVSGSLNRLIGGALKTKKEFIKETLTETCFCFYSEFVKHIEE